jgi:hypothetical protein
MISFVDFVRIIIEKELGRKRRKKLLFMEQLTSLSTLVLSHLFAIYAYTRTLCVKRCKDSHLVCTIISAEKHIIV